MEFLQQNWYWAALAAVSGAWLMADLIRNRGDKSQLSPVEATMLVNREDAIIIDVREQGEFARGHVQGALNIPLGELRAGGTALLDVRLPAGTREVVLVCQSGMRSRVAQAILSGDPTRTYLNLAGGMAAWQSHGLPIVRHD